MSFGTLALIMAIGLLGPLLTMLPARIAPPIVIGEILAGVAFGNTGTHTINPTQPTLAFLADIGFAILMFIVGVSLPLRDSRLRSAVGRGAMGAAITIGIAIALSPLVAAVSGLHRPAVIAVLAASSSVAIVGPVIESLTESKAILVTLTWVVILDVVTVLAVAFVIPAASVGRVVIGATLVIATAAGLGLVGSQLNRVHLVGRLRDASHTRNWALDLRVSLLALFFLAWIAESFDTSVLIAGFAAGVVVAALGEPRREVQQVIGLGEGFFVPLFFVVLGARVDVRSLVESSHDLWLLVLLLACATAAHGLTAVVTRQRVGAGLLATAQLGVPAAVASIGLSTGALRPGQAAAVLGASVLSLVVASLGASMLGATADHRKRTT
jgi:Kef-type K+ transport system membrane component KefB